MPKTLYIHLTTDEIKQNKIIAVVAALEDYYPNKIITRDYLHVSTTDPHVADVLESVFGQDSIIKDWLVLDTGQHMTDVEMHDILISGPLPVGSMVRHKSGDSYTVQHTNTVSPNQYYLQKISPSTG